MKLNKVQQKQIDKQLKAHQHETYHVDIKVDSEPFLKDFEVSQGVFRPDVTGSIELARWLYYNNGQYISGNVLDVGCGSGIQGLVTAKYGANRALLTDVCPLAVTNSKINSTKLGLDARVDVEEGNLFSRVYGEYDLIIFNHPFFPEDPRESSPISKSMLGGEKLLHQFFEEVPEYMKYGASIITSYFHMAGEENDPSIQARKHGFTATCIFQKELTRGLQKGPFTIYELQQIGIR